MWAWQRGAFWSPLPVRESWVFQTLQSQRSHLLLLPLPCPRPQPSLSCLWRVSSHTSKHDESRAVQDRGLGSILVQKSSP